MMPDKVSYTAAEKTAELLGGVLTVLFEAAMITLMASGVTDGENIIIAVVMLVVYGVFSVCGVYPQWTNVLKKPDSASERDFHRVRSGCIIAKVSVCAVLFLISMPFVG